MVELNVSWLPNERVKLCCLNHRRRERMKAWAAFASRLRTLRFTLGSEAVEAAENRGRDVGSAESGYGAPEPH
jgi:hypothetical protein